jgi:hypothetical protein
MSRPTSPTAVIDTCRGGVPGAAARPEGNQPAVSMRMLPIAAVLLGALPVLSAGALAQAGGGGTDEGAGWARSSARSARPRT